MAGNALKFFRKYHKWPGIIFTFFILLFAFSGIVLNHRELLSGIDINRKLLPGIYRYKNWNLASVKSGIKWDPDRVLLFGNIGIWETDSKFTRFTGLNAGFPTGIDNRKINTLYVDSTFKKGTLSGLGELGGLGNLYAGTLFGLYQFNSQTRQWSQVPLPVKEKRIVRILTKGDSLLVLTRSSLLLRRGHDAKNTFSEIAVPRAEDDDNKTGLFKTFWVIHSGEIYGKTGKLIVDGVGIIFIIITLTGLVYFTVPFLLKRVNERSKSGIKRFNRFSLRWHNRFGSWLFPMLILTAVTGSFLRPPLLIPIAGTRVAKIKYSELDSPNPWFDRFRDMIYDDSLHRFLVATSEGIYYSDDEFSSELRKFPDQPPVSVMGINVFETVSPGKYLVGSFSGIFLWEPAAGKVTDYFTGMPYKETGQDGPPFGNVAVAGYLKTSDSTDLIFDYGGGAIPLSGKNPLPPMPAEIIRSSPISLWNTALEIHTGRIFESIIGNFYILIVPLTGLFTVIIIITGFFAWFIGRKKKNPSTGG
jgi:hypothetical protein